MSNKSKQDSVSGKAFDVKLFLRILSYARPYRVKFLIAVFLTFTLSFLSIGRPFIILHAVNDFIKKGDKLMLLYSTIAMLALLLTEALFQFLNGYLTGWLGQSIVKDIRVLLYKHIVSLRSKFFDNTPIGALVTRTISDLEAISDIFAHGFIVIMGDIVMLIVFVVAMFVTDWRLALAVMTTVPLLLIATYIFKNAVKSAFQDVRTQVARLNTFVQEHITGIKIVQVFNKEEAEMNKFRRINASHRDANIRSVWHYSVFFPVVEILLSVAVGLVVWVGGRSMFNGTIQPGEIIFFLIIANMFFRPIRMLADRINSLQMGMVAAERVFKVLDTDEKIISNGSIKSNRLKGAIEFKDVWFAYNDEDWILKGINLNVNPGETIAIIGATGAGKSSVINLLSRYYEFNKGNIFIDEISIRDYDLSALRENVGVILQDVFLFSDTIRNNISLNNPSISLEKIIDAAKKIGAHDFISKLPGAYDFNVGERGAVLSVGQRQLISFIRAYVYDPSVLILDEATSSIDSESEALIQQAIAKVTQNRTSIVIAHRLATIQKADKIIVMDHGQIVEEGTHSKLLASNGVYKKLFELQFRE